MSAISQYSAMQVSTIVALKNNSSMICLMKSILFLFQTPCCNKFYKCRFCHDENESHHFDRKTLTELICTECNTRQKVQDRCQNCGILFGKVS